MNEARRRESDHPWRQSRRRGPEREEAVVVLIYCHITQIGLHARDSEYALFYLERRGMQTHEEPPESRRAAKAVVSHLDVEFAAIMYVQQAHSRVAGCYDDYE